MTTKSQSVQLLQRILDEVHLPPDLEREVRLLVDYSTREIPRNQSTPRLVDPSEIKVLAGDPKLLTDEDKKYIAETINKAIDGARPLPGGSSFHFGGLTIGDIKIVRIIVMHSKVLLMLG